MAEQNKSGERNPVTIKKYANRRLYNTATSSYVTLDDLCQMVKDGIDFAVFDAKTGADITRPVLTQIIVEEESKGQNLLPETFLRQLIAFYGDSLQGVVPKYLEHTMESFATNQEQMRTYMQETFDGLFPFGSLEEMGKKNMEFFEQTMKMFTPPGGEGGEGGVPGAGGVPGGMPSSGGQPGGQKPGATAAGGTDIDDLKDKLEALQAQIEAMTGKKD